MPSYDFEVDLQALGDAADKLGQVLTRFQDTDVCDVAPTEADVAHEVAWGGISEFVDRWQLGIDALREDTEELSAVLNKVAAEYVSFERRGAERVGGIAANLPAVPRPGA
ncbi:hypothetical protein [Austwickia chelonae]|uniref:hypothetical protein n=1 Tax=Austwickia chelonae TaxID=100225 RepID=UPI000E26EE25|nr:hypothetical protein [Austwickia chelonae]